MSVGYISPVPPLKLSDWALAFVLSLGFFWYTPVLIYRSGVIFHVVTALHDATGQPYQIPLIPGTVPQFIND